MEREKMLENWRKVYEQGYHNWNLHPQIYDYFEEKTDEPFPAGYTPSKWYADYSKWIVNELDGPNHELARRMLIVTSQLRMRGLIEEYHIADDLAVCTRIGVGFDPVVKQVLKRTDYLHPDRLYKAAELLLKGYPVEAVNFADTLFTDKVTELAAKKKQDYQFYLMCYMALHLVQENPEGNTKYIQLLTELVKKHPSKHMRALAYYGRELTPALGEFLKEQILVNEAISDELLELVQPAQIPQLLKEINAPVWPYHYLLLTNPFKMRDKNPAASLQKLYADDKESFIQLYERLSASKDRFNFIQSGYLLGMLMQKGEADKYMERSDLLMKAIFKTILNEYVTNKDKTGENFMNMDVPLSGINEKLTFDHLDRGIRGTEAIGVAAILHDYVPLAKRFFQMMNTCVTRSNYFDYNNSLVARNFVEKRKKWLDIDPQESLEAYFETGYTISQAFLTYAGASPTSYYYANYGGKEFHEAMALPVVNENKDLIIELLKNKTTSIEDILALVDLLYTEYNYTGYQPLIDLLSHKSKTVRKEAEAIIYEHEEGIRPLLEKQVEKLKGDAKAIAKRLIKKWDNERKYGTDFTFTGNQMMVDFCTDNYDEDNAKFISWIPEDMLTGIRFADLTGKAPAVVMKYILSEYLSLEETYKIQICDKVIGCLHRPDVEATLENIYQLWKEGGADAKKKMIMVPYCLYASDTQILKLRTQLKDWAEASRGAIAAFVVNAIAMNGGSVALLMVDGMSVKFPNNQVKNAAKAAFIFAAKALEIPEDELSDKIVPTLGFSKEGEKVFDYGGRTFLVTLKPDFSLAIYDNDKQKVIKSLPAPGANDDKVKADAAKKEFAELKKQIKATVQTQTNRLQQVLMNGRRWTTEAWQALFVENPIMHQFATGLIWGVYDDDILTATFRYMEDGTFNTVDEEEYTLPEGSSITLVHPIELDEATLSQWKEQLDDYEIVQPISQLNQAVVRLKPEDIDDNKIIRYRDQITVAGKISSIAKKNNMVRGEVLDGGSFTAFHWVDKYLNIVAMISFEWMYMGQDFNENVTLGEAFFYRLDENGTTNDEPAQSIDPAIIPARFLSSVISTFDQLIES